MTNHEMAQFLIRQAMSQMDPEKDKPVITPGEFLELSGDFIKAGKSASLGVVGYSLIRWREKIADEFTDVSVPATL